MSKFDDSHTLEVVAGNGLVHRRAFLRAASLGAASKRDDAKCAEFVAPSLHADIRLQPVFRRIRVAGEVERLDGIVLQGAL